MASSLSDLSSVTSMFDLSIYNNYVNVHLHIDKLDVTNYVTWDLDVEIWLRVIGMLIILCRT